MAAYIFKLQVTNFSFDRRTFCTSLSSVEIHFQSNRYFTTFIVFSTSMLFIYLCTTFIKRIIHNLICSDALCMRNNVQCTFLVVFSFFEKTTYCCRTRRLSVRLSVRPSVRLPVRLSVCPSVCPSVRPSVEIISFRGNSLPNRPIELKIGLNVREGVVHARKA